LSLRRSKLDITLSVLSSVRDGLDKPTRIMYASNLSWKPIQRILASLGGQGLLREILVSGSGRSRVRYEITEKGLNVLDYFSGAEALLDVENIASSEETSRSSATNRTSPKAISSSSETWPQSPYKPWKTQN